MNVRRTISRATELGVGLTVITTLILAGCGGGGGGSTGSGAAATVTTTITPYKGRFQSGNVMLRDGNGNQVNLSSGGSINASGVASVTYNAGVTYPLTVEVAGTYIDETTGASAVMSASAPLTGLIAAASDAAAASGIPVTAITHMARQSFSNYNFTPASAVAALTAVASNVLGVSTYASAVQPPVFDALGKTADPLTLKLTALAHAIAQSGVGANLSVKMQDIAAKLKAGSAVNAVIPQAAFQAALTSLNGGASSVLPAGTIPPAVTLPTLPGSSLNNMIAGAVPSCATGQVLQLGANGLACAAGTGGTLNVPAPAANPLTVFSITGGNTVGSQLTLVLGGLSSTSPGTYKLIFSNNVQTTATQVSVPTGILYANIPNGAVTGPIVITDTGTGTSVTTSSWTISTPVVTANCYSNANVVTPLPASGVAGVNWSDCSKYGPNSGGNWGKVVWDGTQFAALRNSGGVATSPDGYVWTANTYATRFDDMAFNGARWVAITAGAIFYSSGAQPGGWTTATYTLRNPGTLSGVFAANGRFFVGTNNGSFQTSADGINWTETANGLCGATYQSSAYAGNIKKLFWNGTAYQMFVGSLTFGQLPFSCTSTDGVNWTATTVSFSPATTGPGRTGASTAFMPTLVAWNGSQYLTLGSGAAVWTSPDGVVWTKQAGTISGSLAISLQELIWTGSQYVGVGYDANYTNPSAIVTSPDGLIWTQQSATVPTGQTLGLKSLAYAPGLNRYVGMGYFTTNGLFGGSAMYVSP